LIFFGLFRKGGIEMKNRLKEIQIMNGLSQNKLAKLLDIEQSTISRVYQGRQLSEDLIVKICETLNVTADYLLGLSETNKK
jgi:transcriptional regulator with XRE-family HTH domain